MSTSLRESKKKALLELFEFLDCARLFESMGQSTIQLLNEDDPSSPIVIRDKKGRDRILISQEDYQAMLEHNCG
jgi:hypothetical protein